MNNTWTLVLNKHWTPITVTSVFRAIMLMCRGSAVAIDPISYQQFDLEYWTDRSNENVDEIDKEKIIRLTNGVIEKPEIILLTTYGGVPYVEVNFSRKNLYKRDKHKCQYCGLTFKTEDLSIDHVIPRARNGITSWENCVTACKGCNSKKADRPLRDTKLRLRKRPEAPRWSPIVSFLPAIRPDSWANFIKT